MTDQAGRRSSALRSEDWVACWLGLALIVLVMAGVRLALPDFSWNSGSAGTVFAQGNLVASCTLGALLMLLSVAGIRLMGGSVKSFAIGFPAVFVLGWLSQFIAGNSGMKSWGLTYVITGLFLGLLISNVLTVPGWMRNAVRTEYYIKAGLVILGTNILIGDILQAGLLGVGQAFLVILVIWYVCFWIARKMRVDDEFSAMLATAVSICGVSAAIAACGAVQGDRKKLSYVTSLVLVVAIPMMLVMPWIISRFGIPDVVGGAWLGGTIDTSGAVVAAGEIVGDSAMNAAVIVKFSQNAMLGLAAFALSVWWTFRSGSATGERPSASVIWERFPKFVLGFIVASLLFSFVLGAEFVDSTKSLMRGLRTWWFALAFVCIGLETRFGDLVSMDEGRPAVAFLLAQAVNIFWTLVIAWLLFGGILFDAPSL
ncbi:MAG: putative sulfate exporter family transporter [Bryobacterales bacterium]|nr:putative sulfate exporter family transporter [Bryobacterales bacterium]